MGYMYGTAGSSTYEANHANINDSIVKTVIDTWYEENLISYSSYLADAGFCGDRSLSNKTRGTGIGASSTDYGSYYRLYTNKTPQFSCPQSNDLYTTSSSSKGNKALDYPIGLITADEAAYAGGVYNKNNDSYYLNTGDYYWTMSPWSFASAGADRCNVYLVVSSTDGNVTNSVSARPVINLKSTVEIVEDGDGTSLNPYVIKTN